MNKTKEHILEEFDDNFYSMDKFGVIYGKDNRITMSNNYSQIQAIRNFIEQSLEEYADWKIKECLPEKPIDLSDVKWQKWDTDKIASERQYRFYYNEIRNQILSNKDNK